MVYKQAHRVDDAVRSEEHDFKGVYGDMESFREGHY